MNELERALIAYSYAAPPSHILEAIDDHLALAERPGAPHTIYAELWHIAFWQQMTLDWIEGIETPSPATNGLSFPSQAQVASESWSQLLERFFATLNQAARHARAAEAFDKPVQCPSPSGLPTRTMSVREQLESLAAHNAYHLGRIVMLRQLAGAWPPPSGGNTW